jgi:hypothetical protein
VRKRRLIAPIAVLLLALLVAGVAVGYPSVTAVACPQCYGLTEIADGLYAERGADRQRLVSLAADANKRVAAFYGGRVTSPRLLACETRDCYDRIGGGGERGLAVLNRAVLLSPRGLDPVIAAHEMSHVELHARAGAHRVPQWFDEGLAVVVADDPRYLKPAGTADRCPASSDEPLPETLAGWLAAEGGDRMYALAACRVIRWIGTRTGPQAVADLITSLAEVGHVPNP